MIYCNRIFSYSEQNLDEVMVLFVWLLSPNKNQVPIVSNAIECGSYSIANILPVVLIFILTDYKFMDALMLIA